MPARTSAMLGALLVAATTAGCGAGTRQPTRQPLPLRQVGQLALTGDSSRFDYASLDTRRGLLFVAHLGASQVIEVDVQRARVVRTIDDIADVHGVVVVPDQARVYATATGSDEVVAIDESDGRIIGRAATGGYPDGLAYDPDHDTIWTTNESDGSETVIDTRTMEAGGAVRLGDSVGNVAYDPVGKRMIVAVQSANELAVIDTGEWTVQRRIALPGCEHDHGLALDTANRLAFVACDGNATLLTVDLRRWQVTGSARVGDDPDVLSYDPAAGELIVAAESGWVTVLRLQARNLQVIGRDHLADGAHVVTIDPGHHLAYFPVPGGSSGPTLLIEKLSA